MKTSVYRFTFAPGIEFVEAEATLQLAVLACEGLVGQSRVRMEVSYFADPTHSVIFVDGTRAIGDAVIRIYIAFLTREFGESKFSVRHQCPARSTHASGDTA